jgi:hypothetical protein
LARDATAAGPARGLGGRRRCLTSATEAEKDVKFGRTDHVPELQIGP